MSCTLRVELFVQGVENGKISSLEQAIDDDGKRNEFQQTAEDDQRPDDCMVCFETDKQDKAEESRE